ncbi:Rpn family recombination-promoting nuclease/putative transposase [Limosilactobacillus oris]|uniref:Rpn family recombination-promoting nuclease/putative transposase n=1 Tax=Limosilactobacillus oris TaxID=1632 RepID=UPI0024B3A861|nr:Rpn family recombination-promoting nuclease/putative transposase [Limosilactobacillus oris]WHO86055.1 Rpn family recombination-promoting nuclease/putative transposase [Limosilactobacillus oris]
MTKREQLQAAAAKWEQLTIANDQMFSMVMENNDICLELLRRIFPELAIKRVARAAIQKQVNAPLDARTVRFDVYLEDDQQRTYIVEMQVANHDNLPYRLRYYLEQADHNILSPGDSYDKLKHYPTYIVFFCDFDYYRKGRVKYRFEWRCTEDYQLTAGTGQQLVVFNARADDFRDNIKLQGFLKLMRNQVITDDPFVGQIVAEMNRIKQDPGRRRLFMKYEMDLMDARSEGMAHQQVEDIKLTAKLLTNLGIAKDEILRSLSDTYQLSTDEAEHYLKLAE